jgi:hypothetical protein
MSASKQTSKAAKTKPATGWLVIFFGIFALAGGAAAYFTFVRPVMLMVAAKQWRAVPCVIQSSTVGEHRGDDSTTYSIDIMYQFEWQGGLYSGDRYDFRSGSSSGYDSKRAIVKQHPPGKTVTCYVDPLDPQRSVINREPGSYLLWGLISLPFLGFGLWGTFFSLRGSSKEPRRLRRDVASSLNVSSEPAEVDQLTVLAPASTPLGKFFGGIFFALIWNGITSVFVFGELVPSYTRGEPDVFLSFFITPFVLIGFGTIGFVVYQALALANPRVKLILSSAHLYLGGVVTLSWQISGNVSRLKSFRLTLQARESATYRRGTSSTTDHHVFFQRDIYVGTHPRQFVRGSVDFIIPADSYPSFHAANNKIEWRIHVLGDIPRWPNVSDEYPILIKPSGG